MKNGYGSKRVYLFYTLLFLAAAAGVFFFHLLKGYTFIRYSDGFKQYYPMLVSLRSFCKTVLTEHHLPLWQWNVGMGEDVIASLYSVYCDPFSYLAAAFPVRLLDLGYSLSILLKMYLAGITMTCFLRYRRHPMWKILIGALGYVFSYWAVFSTAHTFFLLPLVLFPLLILGIEKWECERRPLLLVISIALSLATCLYFAFMSAIVVFLYMIVRILSDPEKRRPKAFLRSLGHYLVLAALGFMLAAPLFLPVAQGILHTTKGGGDSESLFYTARQFLGFFPGFLTTQNFFGSYASPFAGGAVFAMLPAVFCIRHRKTGRYVVVTFLLLTAASLFPLFSRIMNAMNYPTGRWYYTYVFFYIWACLEAAGPKLETVRESKKKYITVFVILVSLVFLSEGLLAFVYKKAELPLVLIAGVNFVFALFFLFLFLRSDAGKISKKAVVAALLNLILCYLILFYPSEKGALSDVLERGVAEQNYATSVLKKADAIDDTDFYRVDRVERLNGGRDPSHIVLAGNPANDPMYYGVNTTGSYLSVQNADLSAFYRDLCVSSNLVRRTAFFDNDNRSSLDFLTGIKYYLYQSEKAERYKGFDLSEKTGKDGVIRNRYDTGLGYVYSAVLQKTEFDEHSYVEKEQLMLGYAIVDKDYEGTTAAGSAGDTGFVHKELSFHCEDTGDVSLEDHTIRVKKDGSALTLRIDEEVSSSDVYLSFINLKKASKKYGNFKINVRTDQISKSILNEEGQTNQSTADLTDFLCNLGSYDRNLPAVELIFEKKGTYSFDEMSLIAVPTDSCDAQKAYLEENRLSIYMNQGDHLRGEVESEGGFLFLGIPYNKGWQIRIDGTEQPLYHANIGFMGTDISPGRHEIELIYRPVGWSAAWALFLCSLAALIVFLFRRRAKYHSKSI